MLNKITAWSIYVLAILLSLQTRYFIISGDLNDSYWEYGTFSIYVFDIFLLFSLVLVSVNKFRDGIGRFSIANHWWSIAAFELVVFISVFFASSKALASFGYWRLLLGIGLFFIITEGKYKVKYFYISLIIGAIFQSLIGIFQFFWQTNFSSKWFGIALHEVGELGTSVVEVFGSGRWLRAYGGLDHPNIFGVYLAIVLLLLITIALKYNFYINKNKCYYIFLILSLTILTLGVLCSFSRSAWVALIAGLIVMSVFAKFVGSLRTNKVLLKIIVLIFLFSGLFVSLNYELVATRFKADTRLEQKSNKERIDSYNKSYSIYSKNYFWGVGLNNYTLAYSALYPGKKAWFYQPVHNTYVLILTEIGFIGILAFFIMILTIISVGGIRGFKNNIMTSLLVAVFVAFLFDHWWWSSHFGLIFLFLILGIYINNIKENSVYS